MQTAILTIILGFLLAQSSCSLLLSRQLIGNGDPDPNYLNTMCTPNFPTDGIDLSLLQSHLDSPFPCKVSAAILAICLANGTSEIDYLAEQECLCDGAFWDVWKGCEDCYFVHGVAADDPSDRDQFRSSVSVAECSPTAPSQAFFMYVSGLAQPTNGPSASLPPNDLFPNNTAVSNYWTATEATLTLGSITGSATARSTGGSIDTTGNASSGTDTPTIMTGSSMTRGRTLSTTLIPDTTPVKSTSSSSPSTSKNVATMGGVRVSGGLFAFLITVIVLI
jgi:hypothetical protein